MLHITQEEFSKLIRLTRQERNGNHVRSTLITKNGNQYIHVAYRYRYIIIKILRIYDRLIYYKTTLVDKSPVCRKAIFGVNFCGIMEPKFWNANMLKHTRCPTFDSFIQNNKETLMASREICKDTIKMSDVEYDPENDTDYTFVACADAFLYTHIIINKFRKSCPFYDAGIYLSTTVIQTKDFPTFKISEFYVYDLGSSFFIFTNPLSNRYYKVHKDRVSDFTDMDDIIILGNISRFDLGRRKDIVEKLRKEHNSDPVTLFDQDAMRSPLLSDLKIDLGAYKENYEH